MRSLHQLSSRDTVDFTREGLKAQSFAGFRRVSELQQGGYLEIPDSPGVYVVIRESTVEPKFLEACPVPLHKDRQLAYPIDRLRRDWVKGSTVIYIGKATSLRKRLGLYLRFGQGEATAHRGGRSIWQLSDSSELIVAWKSLSGAAPQDEESRLISLFERQYRMLPFANKRR